jgi:hypothetical protein
MKQEVFNKLRNRWTLLFVLGSCLYVTGRWLFWFLPEPTHAIKIFGWVISPIPLIGSIPGWAESLPIAALFWLQMFFMNDFFVEGLDNIKLRKNQKELVTMIFLGIFFGVIVSIVWDMGVFITLYFLTIIFCQINEIDESSAASAGLFLNTAPAILLGMSFVLGMFTVLVFLLICLIMAVVFVALVSFFTYNIPRLGNGISNLEYGFKKRKIKVKNWLLGSN